MIAPHTLQFLKALKKNNNKEWFDTNRPKYEAARKDFIQLVEKIIDGICAFDEAVAAASPEAKSCVNRINRDIRFSLDKTPYKDNFFALISSKGKKAPHAAYYISLAPGDTYYGGGVYMPMAPELLKFRREIEYNFEEWKEITEDKTFKKTFPGGVLAPQKLTRPPKDFDAESPAIEYLKMKGFYTYKVIKDEEIHSPKVVGKIVKDLEVLQPMMAFLNNALD